MNTNEEKLMGLNMKYGHILICKAQGRITDRIALEKRLQMLEDKIRLIAKEHSSTMEVVFNREQAPPEGFYGKEAKDGWWEKPYYPVKFYEGKQDVSHRYIHPINRFAVGPNEAPIMQEIEGEKFDKESLH